MANFFQQVGLQAGYNRLQKIDTDSAEADVALKQQQVEQGKMALLMNGQIMQARAQIAKDSAAGNGADAAAVKDPAAAAALYQKQAQTLETAGDFEGAKSKREAAKSLLDNAKEAQTVQATKVQAAKEAEANAASDFVNNPTPENAAKFEANYLSNGGDPAAIPKPGTAEYTAFAQRQQRTAMTAKERVEDDQKTADKKQKREDDLKKHQEDLEEKKDRDKNNFLIQQGMLENAKEGRRIQRELMEMKRADRVLSETGGTMSDDVLQERVEQFRQGVPLTELVPRGKYAAGETKAIENAAIKARQAEDPSVTGTTVGNERVLAKMNYQALKTDASAYARTAATVSANVEVAAGESREMIGVARELIPAVKATQFKSINELSNWAAEHTGDTNIVKLNTALNTLVNSYARAVNPKGVGTVSDKDHARALISSAMSNGQLNGALDVMEKEMNAAISSAHAHRAAGFEKTSTGAPVPAKPAAGAGKVLNFDAQGNPI